jgi:DNA-binding GntR family transcriptional regulator
VTAGHDHDADVPAVTLEQIVESSVDHARTVEDRAAYIIRNAIAYGILRPGERLPQDRLAGLLNVSRMPIRAALRQLESEGLVELHPHRGATVRALSPEEISDLYEMRILVETFALRKTVRAIEEPHLERLEAIAADLENAGDHETWMHLRQEFYKALYSIGNTPRVVSTIMQFRAEVSRYTRNLEDPRSQTHVALLERIRLRDPDLAAAWLEAHLRQVAQTRRRQVAESEFRALSGPDLAPVPESSDSDTDTSGPQEHK